MCTFCISLAAAAVIFAIAPLFSFPFPTCLFGLQPSFPPPDSKPFKHPAVEPFRAVVATILLVHITYRLLPSRIGRQSQLSAIAR